MVLMAAEEARRPSRGKRFFSAKGSPPGRNLLRGSLRERRAAQW